MFVIYSIIYAGFVLINALKPKLMETTLFAGVNVASIYGIGLIIIAIILGMLYNTICTNIECLKEKKGETK